MWLPFFCVPNLYDPKKSMFRKCMTLAVNQFTITTITNFGMKKLHPNIRLIAVRPCETQANSWHDEQRERHFNTLALCDEVVTIQTHYSRSCMFKRNRYLVDHAEYLLAVYDGGEKGGTAYTFKYAKNQGRRVIVIHPDTLTILEGAENMANMAKGLCIKDLDIVQISQKMVTHVAKHIEGFALPHGDSLFQESYKLHYDEVEIPDKHKGFFTGDEWFNGANGAIEVAGREHVIMLLASEDYAVAYLLTLQWTDEHGEEKTKVIGDFLCS